MRLRCAGGVAHSVQPKAVGRQASRELRLPYTEPQWDQTWGKHAPPAHSRSSSSSLDELLLPSVSLPADSIAAKQA